MRMNGGTAMTRVRAKPWLVFPALAAVAVVAPALHAQEVDPPTEQEAAEGRHLDVLVGLRGDFAYVPSPGASLDLVMSGPRAWVSLQFLAQMVRWDVQYDPITRRDHFYVGRVRLGLGTGQGPSVYGLFEKGWGVIRVDPISEPGEVYNLTGLGLGAGLTVQRVTASLEVVLGGANRSSPDLYGSLAVSLQYHLRPSSDPR